MTQGYYPVTLSAATSDTTATRTWSRSLSFLPTLPAGNYILNILSQDNAGNYNATIVAVTIAPLAPSTTLSAPAADSGSGGSS